MLSPASHNSHSLGSCHARADGMPLLISACTLSTDCCGADMTWQVTHSCGTEPPSRQHCRRYSADRTCLRGAGLAAAQRRPSHRAVATSHRWSTVHVDVAVAAVLVCFSGITAPHACCPGLSSAQGGPAVLMDARYACGTLARVPMWAASMSSLIGPARSLEIARDRPRSCDMCFTVINQSYLMSLRICGW